MSGTAYRPLVERYQRIPKPTVSSGYCTVKKLIVYSTIICVLLFISIQLLLYLRHVFSYLHLMQDSDGELVVISSSIAKSFDATCLDGSTPGYYYRKGFNDGERKWLFVFPHSDWCINHEDCLSLARSGADKDRKLTMEFTGVLSADPRRNPSFFNWNMVQIIACDGASLLGNSSGTLGSKFVKSSGAANIQAIFSHLKLVSNMETVDQIVIYGRNGGALTAALYTPFIKREVPRASQIHTILHDGLLLDGSHDKSAILSWFQTHSIGDNTLIECPDTSCLTFPALLGSSNRLTIFTARTPPWPVSVTYGCPAASCDGLGYSKIYKEKLMDELSRVETSFIVVSCTRDLEITSLAQSTGDLEITSLAQSDSEDLEITTLAQSDSEEIYGSVVNSLFTSSVIKLIYDQIDCSEARMRSLSAD